MVQFRPIASTASLLFRAYRPNRHIKPLPPLKAETGVRFSEEMHDALTGHSSGGVGRSYGKGFSLKPLARAMDDVQAPVDLRRLKWFNTSITRD
jgi:hypothetical protein